MCGWNPDRTPAREWTFEVEGTIPSQTALGGNVKSGYTYRRYRKFFEQAMKAPLNEIPRAERFRVAVITRLYGKTLSGRWCRPYDWANLVGGCKPLVDTLTNYAVILDDRAECFAGYYLQERSPDGIDRFRIRLLEYAN
jgi:hypothetical protein